MINCSEKELLLYAVTDRHWLGEETLYDQVKKALDGGATFVQLREKNLDREVFLAEAKEIQKLCKEYGVPFVVNDEVSIAKDIDADGVHVGQSDMEAMDVRKILGPDKIIGVSAQTVEQAIIAEKHGADYLGGRACGLWNMRCGSYKCHIRTEGHTEGHRGAQVFCREYA